VLALLRLAAITARKDFRDAAEKTLRFFSERLQHLPQAVPNLLMALAFSLEEPRRVVIAGGMASPQAQSLLHGAHRVYQPHKVVLGTQGVVEPFAKTLTATEGRPTAYVCTGTACQPPTSDPDALRRALE